MKKLVLNFEAEQKKCKLQQLYIVYYSFGSLHLQIK